MSNYVNLLQLNHATKVFVNSIGLTVVNYIG